MHILLSATSYNYFSAFCIEWSKVHAWSECWKEEVLLLREETRHTPACLKYYTTMWSSRGYSSLACLSKDPAICDSLSTYTEHQSNIFASLCHWFNLIWNGLEGAGDPVVEPTPIVLEDTLMELAGGDIWVPLVFLLGCFIRHFILLMPSACTQSFTWNFILCACFCFCPPYQIYCSNLTNCWRMHWKWVM